MQTCLTRLNCFVGTFGGDHGVMDVLCALGTLACLDCLCRFFVGVVGLVPIWFVVVYLFGLRSWFGSVVSSWFGDHGLYSSLRDLGVEFFDCVGAMEDLHLKDGYHVAWRA